MAPARQRPQVDARRHRDEALVQALPWRAPMRSPLFAVMLLPLALGACGGSDRPPVARPLPSPRAVSILVEVFDPATNFVWENVGVRVVEADQEWSQCTCTSPHMHWFKTDSAGQVLLDESILAAAEVGFVEDANGNAILGPRSFEDQATVVLEIDAPGFTPVFVEVDLSWDVPDVFVSVPFN